jgi:hypothetical protein
MENNVTCQICGKTMGAINHLHLRTHSITTAEYVVRFPNSPLTSQAVCDKRSEKLIGREIKWKDKIADAVKKSWEENPNQGRTGVPLSEESKKVVSEKLQGHPVSDGTRLKISETGIGRRPWNKGKSKYSPQNKDM